MTLPPTSPSTPYSQVRDTLNTGDLFFLHSTSAAGVAIENLEKQLGWPPYSHVGMVIRDGAGLYFFDAPGGGCQFRDPYASDPDNRIYGQPIHDGLRVADLDDILAYYATCTDYPGFWLRRLTPVVNSSQFGALRIFVNRVDGQPFPLGPGQDHGHQEETGIAASWFAGQARTSLFYGHYFCAQLVADAYMHMGVLAMEDFPANGYSPAALGMADYSTRLPLVKPAALSDPEFVEFDGQKGTGPGVNCGD